MTKEEQIKELITMRRRQVLVHSIIYYRWNESLISDHTFDEWSKELFELQLQYPELATQCEWAEAYKDFDGSTGAFLPLSDPDAVDLAERVLRSVIFCKRKD